MKKFLLALVLSLWAVPAFAQQEVDATALLFWSGGSPRCEVRVGSGAPSGGNTCDSWFDYSAGVFYVKVGGTWSAMAALSATATSTQVCYGTGAATIACGDADFTFVTDTATVTKLSTTQLLSSGDIQVDPTGNDVYPTTNYDINLGLLSKKYLTLHAAELWVETLVAQNTLATIGGRILVGPTTTLIADITAVSTDIDITYNNVAIGDIVYMESNGKVEFMQITAGPDPITGGYRIAVTRNLDGTGANIWYAGDATFNTGTTGDGFIDLYSVSGVQSASQAGPTIVGNVRSSSTYNAWAPRWAIGNLNGLYSYATDIYGVGLGDPSGSNVVIDATNGYRSRIGTTLRQTLDATDGMRFFKSDGTTVAMQLDMAGNAFFTGTITAGAGAIGGWTIGTDYLRDAADSTGFASTATGGDDVRIWAGTNFAGRASAPFYVTESGGIRATSGAVGGWTLSSTTLVGGNATLTNSGNATFGTSNDVIRISADDATYRLWIGNATAASAPFSVTKAGAIAATSGAIGGFNLGTDYIRDTANSFGLASTATGFNDARLWAGDTFANRATAPFVVFEDGTLAIGNQSTNYAVSTGATGKILWTNSTGYSGGSVAVDITDATPNNVAFVSMANGDTLSEFRASSTVGTLQLTIQNLAIGATEFLINNAVRTTGQMTAAQLSLTGNGMVSDLKFTADATYDIGASGATRPRNYYGSGTVIAGGAITSGGTLTGVAGALSGLLTVTGSGTSRFNGAVNNLNEVRVSNTTSGTAAGARFYLSDNNGDVLRFTQFSSGFTTSGYNIASSALVEAGGSGGLSIASYGPYRTYGSTTQRAEMSTAGAMRWLAYGAGALTTDASGNITAVSDERLKDRIKPLPYGLSEVLALRPIQYGYNEDSKLDRDHLYGGFSAQNVLTVMPLAVGQHTLTGMLTLQDRPILGALVNAIRELSAEVDKLRNAKQPVATRATDPNAKVKEARRVKDRDKEQRAVAACEQTNVARLRAGEQARPCQ